MQLPRFPGALTLRIAVGLFLLLGANTAGFLQLYISHLRNTTAPTMADAIYSVLNDIRNDVRLIPAERRQEWLDGFNSQRSVKLSELPPNAPSLAYGPNNAF